MGASANRLRVMADSQFGAGATGSAPATWYIGLSIVVPNDDGTGFVEPSGGAYARVVVTNNTTNWPAATTTSGVTKKLNGAKITWPNPTALWGPAVAWGAFLASTGGSPEWSFKLNDAITIKSGNTPVELDVGQAESVWK